MLKLPASRIALTNSDLAELDARMSARRTSCASTMQSPYLRLGCDSSRRTDHRFTSAECNDGSQRAESFCSSAILCSVDDGGTDATHMHNESSIADAAMVPGHSERIRRSLNTQAITSGTGRDIVSSSCEYPRRKSYEKTAELQHCDPEVQSLKLRMESGLRVAIPPSHFVSPTSASHGQDELIKLQNNGLTRAGSHLLDATVPVTASETVSTVGSEHLQSVPAKDVHQKDRSSFGITAFDSPPNIERYPPLQIQGQRRRRYSHSRRPITRPLRAGSQRQLSCTSLDSESMRYQQHNSARPVLHHERHLRRDSVHQAQPEISCSTPNLLRTLPKATKMQIRTRSLSRKSANGHDLGEPRASSATSGNSPILTVKQSSSVEYEHMTIATIMSSSPLEELTRMLSSMSASKRFRPIDECSESRPRDTGSISPKSHDTLDFDFTPQQHPVPGRTGTGTFAGEEVDDPPIKHRALSVAPTATESPSSVHPRSPRWPSSPPDHGQSMSSPPETRLSELPDFDPRMPTVTVYNDNLSPTSQPQTPAQLSRSTRQNRARPNTPFRHDASPTALAAQGQPVTRAVISHMRRDSQYQGPGYAVTPRRKLQRSANVENEIGVAFDGFAEE